MDGDEGGVLGGLPRSRPGRRSDKREPGARPATGAAKAARSAESHKSKAADPPREGAARETRPRPVPPAGGPVEGALRLAGKVAETGVKTGVELTRAVLGRLPRP